MVKFCGPFPYVYAPYQVYHLALKWYFINAASLDPISESHKPICTFCIDESLRSLSIYSSFLRPGPWSDPHCSGSQNRSSGSVWIWEQLYPMPENLLYCKPNSSDGPTPCHPQASSSHSGHTHTHTTETHSWVEMPCECGSFQSGRIFALVSLWREDGGGVRRSSMWKLYLTPGEMLC